MEKNEGLFDPSRRFAFTNITKEDFVSAWGGAPIVIKAGDTVELSHHLANKLVDELVDKIMIGDAKMNEVEYYKANPNTTPNSYRAPSSLGVPLARKEWEDKIVRELAVDEESPEIAVIRAEVKQEILRDMSKENAAAAIPVPTTVSEFADLDNKTPIVKKASLRLKKVKVI